MAGHEAEHEHETGAPAPRSRLPGAGRDVGVTFIEVLITIVLMGTVVLGILAATRTAIVASRTASEAAAVETALLSAAERVERAAREDGYTCDLSGPVYAAARLQFGISAAEVPAHVQIAYRHLAGGAWEDGPCPLGTDGQPRYQANLVQRLSITMTSPVSGLTRTLEVLKGDV